MHWVTDHVFAPPQAPLLSPRSMQRRAIAMKCCRQKYEVVIWILGGLQFCAGWLIFSGWRCLGYKRRACHCSCACVAAVVFYWREKKKAKSSEQKLLSLFLLLETKAGAERARALRVERVPPATSAIWSRTELASSFLLSLVCRPDFSHFYNSLWVTSEYFLSTSLNRFWFACLFIYIYSISFIAASAVYM